MDLADLESLRAIDGEVERTRAIEQVFSAWPEGSIAQVQEWALIPVDHDDFAFQDQASWVLEVVAELGRAELYEFAILALGEVVRHQQHPVVQQHALEALENLADLADEDPDRAALAVKMLASLQAAAA